MARGQRPALGCAQAHRAPGAPPAAAWVDLFAFGRAPLTPGVRDARAIAAYLNGQEHALALALHEQTGWPIVGAFDALGEGGHVGVLVPDGRVLDITGARDRAEWSEVHGEEVRTLEPTVLTALHERGPWRAPDVTLARSFVPGLLADIDAPALALDSMALPEPECVAPEVIECAVGDNEWVRCDARSAHDPAVVAAFEGPQSFAFADVLEARGVGEMRALYGPHGLIGYGVETPEGELITARGRRDAQEWAAAGITVERTDAGAWDQPLAPDRVAAAAFIDAAGII